MMLMLCHCASASDDVTRIQTAIDVADAEWTAGDTSVSGYSDAKKAQLGMAMTSISPVGEVLSAPPGSGVRADAKFDWRDNGGVTPVRSQGSCGSCWAFSAIAAVESKLMIELDKEIDLSEQHLISSCCSAGSCSGGWPSAAIQYIETVGVPTEKCYPNTYSDEACNPCDDWESDVWKITDYVSIKSDTESFKWAIKEYGPLSVVLKCPDDWYYYRSGIYEPVTDVGWANHAVLLVGWDDSDGCWSIKNSWGARWGENGYARVKYGNLEKYDYAHGIVGIEDRGDEETEWFTPVNATAISYYGDRYLPTMAIDDVLNTRWFTKKNTTPPAWITFDLGELRKIDGVRTMIYRSDIPMTVDVQVSNDGENWNSVVSDFVINIYGEFVEMPFDCVKTKYVRLYETSYKRTYGMCTEFDVRLCNDTIPDYKMSIRVAYPDRTEVIYIDDENLMNVSLFWDNTERFRWWN